MKKLIIGFLLSASTIAAQEVRTQETPPEDDPPQAVNMFYSDLAPYGEWIELQPELYAWHPSIIDPSWRPYAIGHWVWSDYGWYWVSAEPFGWATYHYGRWYLDDVYGWIWIPDPIWGPAWVEWRSNDDYIGWAPLPPYARFHVTVGIRFTRRWSAPPVYWSFIGYEHFASGRTYHSYTPESYTRRLISTTRSTGRYQIDQNRIVDQGIERTLIERRTSGHIPTVDVTATRQRGVERVTTDGSQERVEIYRPRAEGRSTANTRIVARKAETRPSLDMNRVDQYRENLRHNGEPARGGFLQTEGRLETPGQPFRQRPNINREHQNRGRQLPSPKVEKMTPQQRNEPRGEERSGRRRDRF